VGTWNPWHEITRLLKQIKQRKKEKEEAERERLRERREAEEAERESRREKMELQSLLVAIISAATAFLALLLTYLQLYYSRCDAKQNQRNFEITRKDAADSAAQARQDALDAIAKQLQASKQLKEQAERTANAAESSVAVAAESFHVSERAYVYITPILRRPVAAGQQTLVTVALTNAGRTPALKTSVQTCLVSSESPETTKQAHERAFRPQGSASSAKPPAIPPGQHFEQHLDSRLPLTEDEARQLVEGKLVMYLFSEVSYRDIFGKAHHEEICGRLDTNLKQFNACIEFNKSD